MRSGATSCTDRAKNSRGSAFTGVVAKQDREERRRSRRVPTMQPMPPETIEKRRLVSCATTPASRLPSDGVLATCANSIPPRRPRM